MALFEPAFEATMKHEGGYACDPHDHGGETYMGISRKNWRGWDGWPQIDKIKSGHPHGEPLQKALASNADLQGRVRNFYQLNFWMPIMDDTTDQELANWLFDKAVNMGIQRAYKLLQRAMHIDQDGVIGPQTRAMIHQSDPAQLLTDCRNEARRFYTKLALNDPSQSRFLHGWLARA